jgi:hypothetical protein
MSRGGDTRFRKGHSGNPAGRPKARRPNVSAFDIVFDKTLTVTQGGVEREFTVDEALQLQAYQAALKGSRMAIRQVIKMIEKREVALAKRNKTTHVPIKREIEYSSDNADMAMRLLGIIQYDPAWGEEHPRLRVCTWAMQAAISRPGRRRLSERGVSSIKFFTMDSDKLKWPRRRVA